MTHFGNGDQIDQDVLTNYCLEKGGPLEHLVIFPGANYGHISFKNLESAYRLMQECTS